MKYNILIIIIAIAFLGCSDDFLDKQPNGQISSATFFKTEQDALLALTAVYDKMQDHRGPINGHGSNAWDVLGLAWAHDAIEHPDLLSRYGVMRIGSVQPTQFEVNWIWEQTYIGIRRANEVLIRVPEIPDMDENLRSRVLGEAYFLRAYFYHKLFLWFGGVPIVDKLLVTLDDTLIPRASVDETLAFIAGDLQEAENRLPVSYGGGDLGRVTLGAAKAMMAKILLWQENYPQALSKLQELEGMGYALVDDYPSLFDGSNENSSESVFEIQFEPVAGKNEGSALSLFYAPNGEGFIPNGGWGLHRPIQDIVDEYEPNDSRFAANIFSLGDTFTKDDGTVKTFVDQVQGTGFAIRKYVVDPPTGATHTIDYGPQNWHEIRYAEVVLMLAEAYLQNNQKDEAVAQINRIRARQSVDLPLLNAASMSVQDTWDALIHEFRVEFAFEANFGYTLRRWGIQREFYNEKGVSGQKDLMPIPQKQIDFSKGTLDQNQEYN
ncbi:RagB/SusD family nutrient uptake outer membrane protein [Fulvivirgaceae bacterium BMA10]|uniref:RagB/SusD family nutrient uptake outer membrane protein n=1 Tax=Splendidivirga corallicola TaxID=3051826 RepID=A0ABT8KTV9_9BACT|nr:RagB/SusD family nutrient uptake outer membrane protein [Fulvivirgaceae bacterium BMA10]